MRELKMWIAKRTDIFMPEGKSIVQSGHAVQLATINAMKQDQERFDQYIAQDMPKISVKAKNLNALDRIYKEALDAGIPCSYVIDAARTVFPEPTPTMVCFGPCYRDELPKYLFNLQMLTDDPSE